MAAVHAALVEALRIPEHDRTLRLIEHTPDHFPPPPGRGERFTLVEITLFSGRSIDAKRALYQALARNLETVGLPSSDLTVTLIEVPPENWGIRGGRPASEVELGFTVEV
jgi:phenylpyruvate tautomerase PptA (4-oxalocrotonate tautomerase family)